MVVLAMVGLLSTVTVTAAPPAAAATTQRLHDFDADGLIDTVIGGYDGTYIRYGNGTTTQLTTWRALSAQIHDLNHDGYADLAMTATNYHVPFTVTPRVEIQWWAGGVGGLQGAGNRLSFLEHSQFFDYPLAVLDDTYGVALVAGWSEYSSSRGGLAITRLSSALQPSSRVWITEATAGVPGTATVGNRFGSSLASTGKVLIAGVSGATVSGRSNAGALRTLYRTSATTWSGRSYTQDSAGISGAAERDDVFGARLSAAPGYVAVGTPFEGVGTRSWAGTVHLFAVGSTGVLTQKGSWTQDSPGIAGTSEKDDQLGYSVAVIRPCPGVVGVAAGAPYESLGSAIEAGTVHLFSTSPATCPNRALTQGGALTGRPETDDRVGSTLAAQQQSNSTTVPDQLIIGAWGENDFSGLVYGVAAPYKATSWSYLGFGAWDWVQLLVA